MSFLSGAKPVIDLRGWFQATTLDRSESWVCWYCGEAVSSRLGYKGGSSEDGGSQCGEAGVIRICSNSRCLAPTYFPRYGGHTPVAPPGRWVEGVAQDVGSLYAEARLSAGAGAHTSAVLTCRKILMHIAVDKGAPENGTFISYVEHLDALGFLPPGGKGWVDYIRQRSNDANHEIELMKAADSEALVTFTEMLLRFIYELPSRVPKLPAAPPTTP